MCLARLHKGWIIANILHHDGNDNGTITHFPGKETPNEKRGNCPLRISSIPTLTNFHNLCIKSAAPIVRRSGAVVRYYTFALGPYLSTNWMKPLIKQSHHYLPYSTLPLTHWSISLKRNVKSENCSYSLRYPWNRGETVNLSLALNELCSCCVYFEAQSANTTIVPDCIY